MLEVINQKLTIMTGPGICVLDITGPIRKALAQCAIKNGLLAVTGMHTTTAITVNENEERLLVDITNFFNKLVPAGANYLHDDIHLRDCPPDEPENAHSHLIAMLLGNSESIPINNGELDLGTWQSVMLVELDGARQRSVNLQFIGSQH